MQLLPGENKNPSDIGRGQLLFSLVCEGVKFSTIHSQTGNQILKLCININFCIPCVRAYVCVCVVHSGSTSYLVCGSTLTIPET